MSMCLSPRQGPVSHWAPQALEVGLDPGSYQDLEIPQIPEVKQNPKCQEIIGQSLLSIQFQDTDRTISKQTSCSREAPLRS